MPISAMHATKKFSISAFLSAFLTLLLCLSLGAAAAAGAGDTVKKKKKKTTPDAEGSYEPDKVLYNRAMNDYKKGRYTEERLSLQTLINTYPDSEYLAKAKLAVADSYYKEGGVTSLTQSIAEYKDFITFFPFLDQSAYAQMQVGMAHYRMMEKADRDTSQAQAAEQEFQIFLTKYPNSPLAAKASQHLRNVQEVLADGEFRIATFYYLKGPRSYRASLARLNEVIERYPLYSQSDRALWLAGNIYDKAERRETADQLYARIVREYPSSRLVPDAKRKLTAAGVPIPQPDAKAIAVSAKNRPYEDKRESLLRRPADIIHTGPDVSHAAHAGDPNLTPPDDNQSAIDVLRPGANGPALSAGGGAGTGVGNSIAVQTVPAGSDNSTQPGVPANTPPIGSTQPSGGNEAPPSTDVNSLPAPMASDGSAPPAGDGAAAAPATSGQPAADPAANSPARPTGDSKEDTSTATDAEASVATSNANASGSGNATGNAAANPAAPADSNASTVPATDSSSTPAASTDATKATSSEQASPNSGKADPTTESSSNKKKGIKKIIPW